MSISKFTASLASAHNENTLALANINFDFSLFKVEAPTEYQALGASLSNKRRTEAEAGTQHITARKLGALFDQIPPSTPNLSKAYGRRVSEVSADKAVNPKGTKSDGFFTSYVGADGTTIWAAATSGQAAISVHLLACMLARMWSGPEATSVWVELVKSRKRGIETMYDQGEPMNFQVLAAAQQDLTRIQLADWDASARAWLQTADEAKKLQQKQLMLILKNVRLPVNLNMSVYQSVTQAWKTAMTLMESLIKGMPQRVQDGAVLLGLSAWHLYPDMVVLGETVADVSLKDPLVAPGGSLTIGLTKPDRSDDESGVYWSLSLAHLRYYGDPEVSSRSACGDPSRITFEQLEMAVLGSVLSGWGNAGDDIIAAADWFVALGDFFNRAAQAPKAGPKNTAVQKFLTGRSWMNILVRAARHLVESDSFEQRSCMMLVKLGKRRGNSFLDALPRHPPAMFGLSSLENILPLLKGDEERVEILRGLASDAGLSPSNTIIRYSHQGFSEFATAVPHVHTSTKRQHSGSGREYQSHVRWIGTARCTCNNWCQPETCVCISRNIACSICCHAGQANFSCDNMTTTATGEPTFRADGDPRIINFQANGEKHISLCEVSECSLRSATTGNSPILPLIDAFRAYWVGPKTNWSGRFMGDDQRERHTFDYICGHPETAAIYIRRSFALPTERAQALYNYKLGLESFEMTRLLKPDVIQADALVAYLESLGERHSNVPNPSTFDADYYRSLKAFEHVARVYKQLPNATVAVSVLCLTLHHAHWERFYVPSRSCTFASIAMFESGSLNIKPEMLKEVMAMSSGNSIYVATPLLCDPSEVPEPYEIRRIIGNVGRAGIAMLIPPQDPRVREPKLESWRLINHANFDGTTEDCFKNTTLHLSFTGYEIPIDTGSHGGQDIEVFLLESLVSVHDQGQWVADLNVFKCLSRLPSERDSVLDGRLLRYPGRCLYPSEHLQSATPPFQLTAIDNWEEFLDKPESAGFVRAHDNWAARLALTVLSVHQGYDTYVLQGVPCWSCFEHLIKLQQTFKDRSDRSHEWDPDFAHRGHLFCEERKTLHRGAAGATVASTSTFIC